MKVLFIAVNPDQDDIVTSLKVFCIYEERDVLYVSALLKEHGHEVMLCDKDIEEVDYKALDGFNPDIIVLPYYVHPKMVEWAKSKRPGALVTLGIGGMHSFDRAIDWLKKVEHYDFCLVGRDPYAAWLPLLDSLEAGQGFKGVKGIVYRQGNDIKKNPGSYPFDINQFKTSDIVCKDKPAIIATSMNCWGGCSFCSMNKGWKARKVDDVIDEIRNLINNGVNTVRFADETFEPPDKGLKRLKELCRGIMGLEKAIYYRVNFRPDFSKKATDEVMELLLGSGLTGVYIGVESGNQYDLDLYKKRCTIQDIKNTIKLFNDYAVHIEIGFIMFNPFSTLEGISQNIDLLESIGMADFRSVTTLYQGNDNGLFKEVKKAGLYDKRTGQWAFKDIKAGAVFEMMQLYLNTLKPEIIRYEKALKAMDIHYRLMHYYNRKQLDDDCSIKADEIRQIESVAHAMSMYICGWVRELIQITKEGFDFEKAVGISSQLINKSIIDTATDYIERMNKKALKPSKA